MDFTLEEGKTTAIVGRPGSGKSTIMGLMSRLYDPSDGLILIDGVQLRHHEINNLRQQMGYVGQDPVIYSKTIGQNVKFGARIPQKYEDVDVQNALKKANAWNFVKALKEGIHTKIGQLHETLSEAEKFKIALARAKLDKPRLLLLDIATSQMNAENVEEIRQGLKEATQGVTSLIIADRVRTIMDSDKIIVLEDGKKVQEGTHEELLLNRGIYQQLFNQQKDQNWNGQLQKSGISSQRKRSDPLPNPRKKCKPFSINLLCKRTKLVLGFLAKKQQCFVLLVFISVVFGAIFPLFSFFFSLKLKKPEKDYSILDTNFAFMKGLAVFSFINALLFYSLIQYLGVLGTSKIRTKAFESILNKQPEWHDNPQHSSQALSNILEKEVPKIKGASNLANLLHFFFTLITGVIIAVVGEWKIGLKLVVPSALITWGALYRSKLRHDQIKEGTRYSQANLVLSESVCSMKTVFSFGSQKNVLKEYCSLLQTERKQRIINSVIESFKFASAMSISYFSFSFAFLVGQQFYRQDWIQSLEDIFIPIFAIMFIEFGFTQTDIIVGEIYEGQRAENKVFDMIDQGSSMDQLYSKGNNTLKFKGETQFKNVSFSYSTDRILHTFNLKVLPKQKVALVGRPGSGKSTILRLIQRFYDVKEGEILMDEVSLKEIHLEHLRKNVSIVQEEPILFDATIEANIRYGSLKTPKQVSIEEAAKESNAMCFIKDKLDHKVGPKGCNLTKSQKYRVALARAIFRKPQLLLLDQPALGLARQDAKVIISALENIMQNRTCIVATNRVDILQKVNYIHVLQEGKVQESGTHRELLRRKGLYYELYTEGVLKR